MVPRSVLLEIADPIEFYAELISEDFFAALPIDTNAHQALLRREAGGREVTAHVRWWAYASESCVARVFALHRLTLRRALVRVDGSFLIPIQRRKAIRLDANTPDEHLLAPAAEQVSFGAGDD
jgi:hypothetical protein